MSSWNQAPFSGAPPIPNGFNIAPNLWQAGQWMPNPRFNWNSFVSSAASHFPQSWAPSAAWGRISGTNGAGAAGGTNAAGQAAAAAQAATRNPYKRTPREPSAEYLAQPLSKNPLGLTDMVPREQLYGPGKDGALPETPWIWNPRNLSDEDTDEDDTDSGSESPSPPPVSRPRSPQRHASDGFSPSSMPRSSSTPLGRHASEHLAHPVPITANNVEPNHQPLQPTFSSRIVRTPDHYRNASPVAGGSHSRNDTMPSIESQLSGMSQLSMSSNSSSLSRRSSTASSAPPSRQSSTSSITTNSSSTSTGSMSGLNVISDEPADLLSPLVMDTPLPSAPKPLARNYSAPAAGGQGYSALSAIPEGSNSGSDHIRRRSKGHKSRSSQNTSAIDSLHSSSTTPTPQHPDPHSAYASSRSHTTPTAGATSASQYASEYAARSRTSPAPASNQSVGHYSSNSSYSNQSSYSSHSTQPSSSASAQAAQTPSHRNAGSSHTNYTTYRAQTTPNSSSDSSSQYFNPSNPPAGSSHTTYRSHTAPTPTSSASASSYSNQVASSKSRRSSSSHEHTILPISNNPLPEPPRIIPQTIPSSNYKSGTSSASANAAANTNKTTAATSSNNNNSYNYKYDDNKASYNTSTTSSSQKYNSSYPPTPSNGSSPTDSVYPVTPSSSASNQAYTPYTPYTPATPASYYSSRSSHSSPSAPGTRSSMVSTSSGSGSASASASGSSGHVPLPPPATQATQTTRPPSQPPSKPETYILASRDTYVPLPTPPPQAIEISRRRHQEEAMRKAEAAAQLASPPGSPPNPGLHRQRVRKGFWNRRGDHYIDGYIVYAPLNRVYPYELGKYPGEFEGYKDEYGRVVSFVAGRPELPDSMPDRGYPPKKPYEYFLHYTDES